MGSAIITIVVVAIMVLAIFGLAWLGYASTLKEYKVELDQGKYDIEICHERYKRKEKSHIGRVISYMALALFILVLFGLFVTGIVFKSNGKNFAIDGKTVLVVKSGSMSGFCNDELAEEYKELGYAESLQFKIGDICLFEETNSDLKIGEVYAYSYKGDLITHRLVGTHEVKDNNGNIVKTYYVFRGDNNTSQDQVLITEDKILYHYTGSKIPAIGNLILFAQSKIGMWSLITMFGIIMSSDYVIRKIQELNEERLERIGCAANA